MWKPMETEPNQKWKIYKYLPEVATSFVFTDAFDHFHVCYSEFFTRIQQSDKDGMFGMCVNNSTSI